MSIRHTNDQKATERGAYARHLVGAHALPGEIVRAITSSGMELREYHDQEHDDDSAVGLRGDGHGDDA